MWGDEDELPLVAEALRWPRDEAAEVIGGGWAVVPPDGREPDVCEPPHRWDPPTWWMAGSPPQVMLSIGRGEVSVARPRGVWAGHRLTWEAVDVRSTPMGSPGLRDWLARQLKEVQRRRRASFRWCRFCRDIVAPENRTEADVCHGCASRHLEVVV